MNTKSISLTIAIIIATLSTIAQVKGTYKDIRDGKVYKTIKIGTQTWMAENIAYKTTDGCWAYNNDANNVKIYGYLYDWKSAKKAVPKGWHLPSDAEWNTLINFLGGANVAGGKLKNATKTYWKSPNTGATNKSGYNAMPGGYHDFLGTFKELKVTGYWWTATDITYTTAWYESIGAEYNSVIKGKSEKTNGYSVRCIKD